MARRGENIYKRKDGRWEGRVLKADGKYRYVYAKTYREIKEKKRLLQEKSPFRITKNTYEGKKPTELFEIWLKEGLSERVKPATYESYYRCIAKYVIPYFKETKNAFITGYQVDLFVKQINNNTLLSESYKRKILSIFKTALKEIMKGTPEYEQILSLVTLPKVSGTAVQVFSLKEQRLVENAILNFQDKMALGILLCFYTGIRLGEICALKWEDIDFEAGTMSITKTVARIKSYREQGGKTALLVGMPKSQKSVRKIPLPGFVLKKSDELKKAIPNESCYVLSGSDAPIDPRTYQKLYKRVLKSAGVKYRKFHAIRHTFATRALELGVDIKTLSEILGHSNVSITLNIYTHSLYEQKKRAIDKLNEMYITHTKTALFAVASPVTAS